jgi:hypothetical protein
LNWIGCVLLVSGWAIVIAALLLLAGLGDRFAFISAGLLVEVLGLALLGYSFTVKQRAPEPEFPKRRA